MTKIKAMGASYLDTFPVCHQFVPIGGSLTGQVPSMLPVYAHGVSHLGQFPSMSPVCAHGGPNWTVSVCY